MNSLLTNLTPPKIQIWPKFLAWNSRSKSYISLNTWWISTNEDSKLKINNCLQSKNSCILSIGVINFKLRLINFVYFFWDTRYGRTKRKSSADRDQTFRVFLFGNLYMQSILFAVMNSNIKQQGQTVALHRAWKQNICFRDKSCCGCCTFEYRSCRNETIMMQRCFTLRSKSCEYCVNITYSRHKVSWFQLRSAQNNLVLEIMDLELKLTVANIETNFTMELLPISGAISQGPLGVKNTYWIWPNATSDSFRRVKWY